MQDKPRKLPVFFSPLHHRSKLASWQPAADIYRTQDGWLVKFDVAGVKLEDIVTEITATEVRIQGCRRDIQAREGCRHHSMEISYNRFERFIALPCDLTGAQVRVDCCDGILLVRLITEGDTRE